MKTGIIIAFLAMLLTGLSCRAQCELREASRHYIDDLKLKMDDQELVRKIEAYVARQIDQICDKHRTVVIEDAHEIIDLIDRIVVRKYLGGNCVGCELFAVAKDNQELDYIIASIVKELDDLEYPELVRTRILKLDEKAEDLIKVYYYEVNRWQKGYLIYDGRKTFIKMETVTTGTPG